MRIRAGERSAPRQIASALALRSADKEPARKAGSLCRCSSESSQRVSSQLRLATLMAVNWTLSAEKDPSPLCS